jgi:hypothetical protein
MILAPKISHTFLSEGRSVLALLTGSEITLFFRCSEGSIALTKVDFPTPECPENILLFTDHHFFQLFYPFISVEETRRHLYPIS